MNERELAVVQQWRANFAATLRNMMPPGFPKVITLCGSTRFKEAFIQTNYRLTMKGNIVISVGWFSHADAHVYTPTPEEKIALDELHFRKIDLSDAIYVINVGGYVGQSTRNEINYAIKTNKEVLFLETA